MVTGGMACFLNLKEGMKPNAYYKDNGNCKSAGSI